MLAYILLAEFVHEEVPPEPSRVSKSEQADGGSVFWRTGNLVFERHHSLSPPSREREVAHYRLPSGWLTIMIGP